VPETRSAYRLTAAAFGILAFGICYSGIIASTVRVWSTQALYSYGFAVPVIAAYVLWTNWNRSRPPQAIPDYVFGIPVTLAGVTMLVIGQIGALVAVQQVSMIVTLTGVLLLLFGRDVVRLHWFPIAYLLLMIPIWNAPISHLQDPSRILSAKIAANLLDFSGVPVIRQGTEIVLPSQTLSVMLECSGVNQLIALTAMVVPATYLWLDTNLRRIALLLFAVTISYLSNGLRIALVGWLAINGLGDGDLNGSAHLFQGLLVSTVGYLAIGAFFSLLSRSRPEKPQRPEDGSATLPAAPSPPLTGRRVWLDIAMLLVILVAGASRLSASQLEVHLTEDLRSLESQIGDWTLEIDPPPMAVPLPSIDDDLVNVGRYPSLTGERRFSAVDDELVRVYRNSSGNRVRLYIGYYHRQEDGRELTGEAGTDLAVAASTLTLGTESRKLELNEIVRTKADMQRGVLFWYDINGRIVSDFYRLKSYTIWDAVTRRRTNGAVVMIGWDGPAGPESQAARERAIEFARALMPVLRRHLPV
jgi:EpsI family protein